MELAARTNDSMTDCAVSRMGDILAYAGVPMKNSKLLVPGIGFKKDMGDTRNSPALRATQMLYTKGVETSCSNRRIPEITVGDERSMTGIKPDASALQQYNATIILVNHSDFGVESIVHNSNLGIDACNATRSLGSRPWTFGLFA